MRRDFEILVVVPKAARIVHAINLLCPSGEPSETEILLANMVAKNLVHGSLIPNRESRLEPG